jgi:hypothetical protein
MLKRLATMAITAALALIPVTVAHAGSSPLPPDLHKLEQPCILKVIKPPNSGPTVPNESLGVENKYADDDGSHTTVEHDATVEHDDFTYPC